MGWSIKIRKINYLIVQVAFEMEAAILHSWFPCTNIHRREQDKKRRAGGHRGKTLSQVTQYYSSNIDMHTCYLAFTELSVSQL